jgi:hypothetical protein
MSVAVQINIADYATKSIEAKLVKCSPRRIAAETGRPLAEFWRNRLRSHGPNKRSWPSTRFYERAARSVKHIPSENSVTLRADHQGLRQRWKGGVISAKKAKALAIPISPVSYGKTPAEFPGLFLMQTRKGAYLVQPGQGLTAAGNVTPRRKGTSRTERRRRKAALNFLFVLKKSVRQDADPRVVPTNDEFAEVALARIAEAIK